MYTQSSQTESSNYRQPLVTSNRIIPSNNRGGISQNSKEISGTATSSTKAYKFDHRPPAFAIMGLTDVEQLMNLIKAATTNILF